MRRAAGAENAWARKKCDLAIELSDRHEADKKKENKEGFIGFNSMLFFFGSISYYSGSAKKKDRQGEANTVEPKKLTVVDA